MKFLKVIGLCMIMLMATETVARKAVHCQQCEERAPYPNQPQPFACSCSRCVRPTCYEGRWRTRYRGYPYYRSEPYGTYFYRYGINFDNGNGRRWW